MCEWGSLVFLGEEVLNPSKVFFQEDGLFMDEDATWTIVGMMLNLLRVECVRETIGVG